MKKTYTRVMGRKLAKELTNEDLAQISGGSEQAITFIRQPDGTYKTKFDDIEP